MTTVWSRWLLGAWAVATVVWLMVATLMLVQTWPEPSFRSAMGSTLGQMTTSSRLDAALRGQVGAATTIQERIATILLITLSPPVILLMLVLGGMRFAGLPLPSLRRAARNRSSRAES
jgi:hypothetical protein